MAGERLGHGRTLDVVVSLVVAAALVVAMHAGSFLAALQGGERALAGRARVTGAAPLNAAASLVEKSITSLESQAYDRRMDLRSTFNPCPLDPRIVLVEIDDVSLSQYGRWPWPRDRLAALVRYLKELGCRAVFLDIELAEPSGPADDVLAAELARPVRVDNDPAGRGGSFGVMYQEDSLEGAEGARARTAERILRWASRNADQKRPAALPGGWPPEEAAGWTRYGERALTLARYLWNHRSADQMAVVIDGVVPELTPPAPPAGDHEIHPTVLMLATMRVLAESPETTVREVLSKACKAMGHSDEVAGRLAATELGTVYLPRLCAFFSKRRRSIDELGELVLRSRALLFERLVREYRSVHRGCTEQQALDGVTEVAQARTVQARYALRQAVSRVIALDVPSRRDVRWIAGSSASRLPVRGPLVPPVPSIGSGYQSLGISTVERDRDGIVRRQPLLFRLDAESDRQASPGGATTAVCFAAALNVAADLLDLDRERVTFRRDRLELRPKRGGVPLDLPVDGQGHLLIDFRGRWKADGFPWVNAVNVLDVARLESERERYVARNDTDYPVIRSALELGRSIGEARTSLSGPVPAPLAMPAGRAWAASIAAWEARLSAELDAITTAVLSRLTVSMTSLLRARDEARRAHDATEEKEVEAELAKDRHAFENVVVDLPVLRQELTKKVAGKVCLVGLTATSTTDISASPLEERYINLGVHATLLNQILQGSRLRRPPWVLVDLPILLFYALLVPLIVPVLSIRGGAFAVLGLVALHVAGSSWFLVYQGLWVDAVTPVLALLFSYFGITLRRYLSEERQKRKIRAMFETYLDRRVVEAMVQDEMLWHELGGTSRTITAFFSDIEGFTTVSELLDSGELSTMLVDYLTPMTEIILEHEGLRDKYIGDAIVACFGAPYPYPDHAVKACLAAVEQQERITGLKAQWAATGVAWYRRVRDRGLDLRFRIGLNTGLAKVGNFGSRDAKNWTMIGDTVNLASRLEGANKGYKTRIMISESTYAGARSAIEARELDLLKVVGKLHPVRVFEVLGRKGQVEPGLVRLAARFAEALQLYRARRFDEARTLLEEIHREHPEDGPTATYLGRLADRVFLVSLPSDWDGAFISKEK
ncbi:MAG: CHASE2 domain-containing protein [Candidatus Riflebacteria bacterium]|nr:CHASE2 domain-containing protein [Candidatus Riflebacteria bacterium]